MRALLFHPRACQAFISEQVDAIREQVGDKKVLLALSGGVDSSVVAALLIKAIGKQLICVHVNHGLMRKGESEQVVDVFENQMDANLVYVDATDRFLDKLVDVDEPEAKRAYDWLCIIRCINTVDVMTAEVPELDWALPKRITARVTAEVPGICRVCYDLTPKPVGTVEWE